MGLIRSRSENGWHLDIVSIGRTGHSAVGFALAAVVFVMGVGSTNGATTPEFDGGALYSANCTNCHGVYGDGEGVITPSLSVAVRDLRYLSARNGGQFPTRFVVEIIDGRATRAAHGPEGMPVWGTVFARSEGFDEEAEGRVAAKIQALTAFLEALQIDSEKKSASGLFR